MNLFEQRTAPALVGVIHLPALPGAPRAHLPLSDIIDRARADALALAEGGAAGVIVENLGDVPFAAGSVDAATVAHMTLVAHAVKTEVPQLELGINVLRNDGMSALAIAHAVGASFIRVNVLSGAMVTDQGLIEGQARQIALERRRLGTDVRVLADVLVKHAVPLGSQDLADVAKDTWLRAGADGLVVTGTGTGHPTRPEDVARVREACPEAPLAIGSGLDPSTANDVKEHLDIAIVGTWLHQQGRLDAPLSTERVRKMADALR